MPELRNTGISEVGDRPWGTHLCHLYQSGDIEKDLVEVVAPYLQAGLEGGEFCLWSVSPPLTPVEARLALARLIPDVDDHIRQGRLEIVSHREWFVGGGPFESDKAIGILTAKLNRALALGYPGVRFATMRTWVSAEDRRNFVAHEELLDATVAGRPVLGLCSYDLEGCLAADVPDILAPHCAVLIKRNGRWKCCEPTMLRRTAHLLLDSQAQLQESKSKYQTLLENIPQRVFYKDANSVFVTVNANLAHDFGLQPGDFVGHTDYDFFPTELAEKYRRDDRRIRESGVAEQVEEDYVFQGRRLVVDTVKVPIRDDRGNVMGILGVSTDVTDRKRADEERAFEAALIQARSETSPDGILFVDNQQCPLPLNKRFAEMWNVPAEILSSPNEKALVNHVAGQVRNRDAFLARVAHLYAHPEEKGYDELELKDGRVYERYTYPLYGKNGEHFGRIWYFRDMTEHRRVQESLERAKEAAEAANRAKSEFLANMSHEIRTPMTAILGFTDLLGDPDLSSQERAEFLETIRRNGKALLDLIGKILDLSKIEAEKMSLEPIACDVPALVEDVVATLRAQAAEKGLRLDVDYLTPLPATIEIDPARLRQILLNLIGNAVKFTDEGGVCVMVEYRVGPDDAALLKFMVSDTGIGVPQDKLRELFRPFTQADASTTRRFGGTGLGLAISKRLAKMLGGDIDVRSRPGEGSTFTLTIRCGASAG